MQIGEESRDSMGNLDTTISKDDTKVLKAIAVLLMLMHHLWYFPERIYGGGLQFRFWIFDEPATVFLGHFGQICVSFFFFLGGYGVYSAQRGKPYDVVDRLKKLYIPYWKVFFVFVPIGYLFCSNQPDYVEEWAIYGVFSNFYLYKFLQNLFGITCTYNREWWFLSSYAAALITFPAVRAVIENKKPRANLFLLVTASILISNVVPALGKIKGLESLQDDGLFQTLFCLRAPEIASFWMGCVCTENGLLDRLRAAAGKAGLLNPLMDLAAWAAAMFLRMATFGLVLDVFLIPVLCVTSLDLLRHLKGTKMVLLRIGEESTNMWLIHTFFCYYFFGVVKIVVAPKWAVPSLLVLILLSYGASVALTWFWKGVSALRQKVRRIWNGAFCKT